MKEMWNERYRSKNYAYGTTPNAFFKNSLERYQLEGSILLPAEGEGRNAVYAAQLGLDVTAFDISEEGRKKALRLAKSRNVSIEYLVGDFLEMDFSEKSFDMAALIHAHFTPDIVSTYHKKIARVIKPNGMIILEGFSKNNLPLREKNPRIGGPKNLEMLFTTEGISKDFPDFEILELEEVKTELNEGDFHIGIAKVIRFVGKKRD